MDRSNKKNSKNSKILYKCITANTSVIWQNAAHTTNRLLLTAKQEPYKKAYLLTKNIEEFSGKSSGERARRQKKDKTEKVTGLGRKTKTREEIVKWNQMTALRSQTGRRHQTSPASLREYFD